MSSQNQGQQYEQNIRNLLQKRVLLPATLQGNDAGFIHRGGTYYLEVKNRTAPDFGQKGIVWNSTEGWSWREKDIITDLYDELGVINFIDRKFIPRRHSVPINEITSQDIEFDQRNFEKSGIALNGVAYLHEYYARKQCFYIQLEGRGFYYLKHDIASLGVPQFAPQLTLRLRAKKHHSSPIYAYSFFAVIQVKTTTIVSSNYDLEEKVGRFPPITS